MNLNKKISSIRYTRHYQGCKMDAVKFIDQDQIWLTDETDTRLIARAIVDLGVQEDPFYLLDLNDVIRKYEVWCKKIPRVKPFYAVKCNDHPFILNVLAALGTGFDCATKAEIKKILDLGVDPSRIIFAHPTKIQSHLDYARETNVPLMTFDNEYELVKIKRSFPTAKLVLRVRCDALVAQIPLGNKFGCNLTSEAPNLLKRARNLSLDVVGVSFHVGSGCGEPEAYGRSIADVSVLFVLGRELGFQMQLLDIGGGYRGGKDDSLGPVADVINSALDQYFPDGCGVEVISEPGTYFVASSISIVAPVHSKRTVDHHTEAAKIHNMYWINEGLYTSFDMVMHEPEKIQPIVLKTSCSNPTALIPSTIWGCTMSDRDCIKPNTRLPDLDVGDWILFENMGAYSNVIGRLAQGTPVPKFGAIIQPSMRWLVANITSSDSFPVKTLPTLRRRASNAVADVVQGTELKTPLHVKLLMMCKRIGLMWHTNKWSLTS